MPQNTRCSLAATLASLVAMAGAVATAGGAVAQTASPAGLPTVPTTRILAIGHLTAKASPVTLRGVMPAEVRATVQLYLAGKIDQWYVRHDKPGVVFILNLTDPAEAHAALEALPLGQAGLMDFDYIPLGPLAPLGLIASADRP